MGRTSIRLGNHMSNSSKVLGDYTDIRVCCEGTRELVEGWGSTRRLVAGNMGQQNRHQERRLATKRHRNHKKDLDKTDVYTLRRIVPADRGLNWGG